MKISTNGYEAATVPATRTHHGTGCSRPSLAVCLEGPVRIGASAAFIMKFMKNVMDFFVVAQF